MEEELDQLKSVLRSLVVSSPTQVDARSLLRDYRSMVGSELPYSKFGYRDPIAFLRELCSDCFLGSPANPVLTLIVPDALKHVDKFVQKQRVSSNNSAAKYKGKRRSVLASTVKPSPDLIASTFSHGRSMPNRRTPETVQKEQEYTNCIQSTKLKENTTVNNGTARHNGTQHTHTQVNSRERPHESRESIREDDDSGRLTASSSSSGRRRTQLEELKRDLRELVVEHPDGVFCTDLIRLYRQRHSSELNFSRFGFTSVLSLAGSVDGVRVTHDAAQGDWLLSDAERAPPAPAPAPRPVSRAASYAALRARPAADPEDALPGIPYAPEVFPPDCMGLLDSIPALGLAGVVPGDQLEVSVGEVYSPSHFWLQRLGDEYNIAMETVMDDMNRYYSSEEGKSRRLLAGAVRVGFYCSSCYDGDWHRSLIVRVLDADTVKVRHVDYGTVERCAVSGLRPLRREWAALPAQALRGRLARVRPPAAGRRWPRAAAFYFLQLVRDRRLVATVSAADPQEGALEVFLTDTSKDEDLCITGELVRAGHADSRPDDASGTSECYLFPRFAALESGATPNFAEIHAYLRDGIALEFVDDYRQHVPPCLPPAAPPPADTSSSSSNEDDAPAASSSSIDDDAPADTAAAALDNRVPLFPTQLNEPAYARRNIPVCATAPQPPQPAQQQHTPQPAPQRAMRYYQLHPAPSVPNLSYAPSVPNLPYRTQPPEGYYAQAARASPYPSDWLVYLTRGEAEAAASLTCTAPDVAFRFLVEKLHRALAACPGLGSGAAPLNPDAAEFRAGPPAPPRRPPGFDAGSPP